MCTFSPVERSGCPPIDVLGGDEVIEPRALDRLRELLEEPRVVAEVGMAERDAVAHGLSVSYSALKVTSPNVSNSAWTESPGWNGIALMNEPERRTCPGSSSTSYS